MANSRSNFRRRAACLAVLLALSLPGAARAQSPREYELKAAFLYNFGQFVEWPAAAFSGGGPFSVCVLGRDPFGADLDQVLEGETIRGRPISIRRLDQPEEARQCQLLFVAGSERDRLAEILEAVRDFPVLTVGDTRGFAEKGGIINLIFVQSKIRFMINTEAAKRAGLKVSSQLLKLAIVMD